jgi:hypothetical protein
MHRELKGQGQHIARMRTARLMREVKTHAGRTQRLVQITR